MVGKEYNKNRITARYLAQETTDNPTPENAIQKSSHGIRVPTPKLQSIGKRQ